MIRRATDSDLLALYGVNFDGTAFIIDDPEPCGCVGFFRVEFEDGERISMGFMDLAPGYKNGRQIVGAAKMALAEAPEPVFVNRDEAVAGSLRFLQHFGFKEVTWRNLPLLQHLP